MPVTGKVTKQKPRNREGSKTRQILTLATTTPALPSEIASSLNTSEANVSYTLQRYGIQPKRLESFKKNRANILAAWQMRILKYVTDEKLKNAAPGSLVLAACQLYDKEQIERGGSSDSRPLVIVVRGGNAWVQVNAGGLSTGLSTEKEGLSTGR